MEGTKPEAGVESLWCKLPTYNGIALPRFPPVVANVSERMTAIRNLSTNASDILYCTFPKSGTNWIGEIILMLIQGPTELIKTNRGLSWLEINPSLDEVMSLPLPRVICTHVPVHFLPKNHLTAGNRIIHVMRNPKDVTVSMFNHFSKDIGALSEQFPGSWDNFVKLVSDNAMKLYGGWFNYVKQFEKEQEKGNLRNVHTVFYENMHQNPNAEIKRLADFLEVECNDAMATYIQEACSLNTMFKRHENSEYGKHIKSKSVDGKTNYLFRKGVVGDWKNWFTVKQNELFDAALKRELGDSKLVFKYEL